MFFFFVETINHLFGFNVPSFVVVFMIWDDFFTINMNVMKVIYKVIVFAPHDSCLISDFRGFSYVSFWRAFLATHPQELVTAPSQKMGLVRGPPLSPFWVAGAGKEVKVKDPEIYRQIWWEILSGCRDNVWLVTMSWWSCLGCFFFCWLFGCLVLVVKWV